MLLLMNICRFREKKTMDKEVVEELKKKGDKKGRKQRKGVQ